MPEEATSLSEPARQLSSVDAVRGLAWACARWALATHPHGFPPSAFPSPHARTNAVAVLPSPIAIKQPAYAASSVIGG